MAEENRMDYASVVEKRKRKTRTDEEQEEEATKKTARKISPAPQRPDINLEKEIRLFKIFESKVKLIQMEDIQNCDLQEIKKKVPSMLDLLVKLAEENINLKKQNNTSKKLEVPDMIESRLSKFEEALKLATDSIRELKNHPAKTSTYADKVKAPAVQKIEENRQTRNRHVVAIYQVSEKNAINSDETKTVVLNTIVPTKEKLQICSVRKIANKGILVETRTKEDLERVIKSEKLQAAGLKTEVPSKKKPLLIVYNVPKETTDKEFLTGLKKQNCGESQDSKMFEKVTISHRTGTVKISQINAQNSKSVADELRQLVHEHKIDILAIQEPYVHNNSVVGMGINTKIVTDTKNIAKSVFTNKIKAAIVIFNKEIDVLKIEQLIDDAISATETASDVESVILKAAKNSIPTKTRFSKSAPLWNSTLTKLRKEVREMRRKYKKTINEKLKLSLRKGYYSLRNKYISYIRKEKQRSWEKFSTEAGNKEPWSIVYKI
ncbi:hypothetical protein M0802_016426 [Mischocyttarus mexicanus]|nr:hypothetical protein M0802_016426 [Mischocyttarus mexicanus]